MCSWWEVLTHNPCWVLARHRVFVNRTIRGPGALRKGLPGALHILPGLLLDLHLEMGPARQAF